MALNNSMGCIVAMIMAQHGKRVVVVFPSELLLTSGDLYACGHFISEQFTSEARLYKSTNGGQSWEQVATPGLETLTANAIFEHKESLFISGSLSQMGQKYGVYIMK